MRLFLKRDLKASSAMTDKEQSGTLDTKKLSPPLPEKSEKKVKIIDGPATVSLSTLFRYSTSTDIALMVLGGLLGFVQGCCSAMSSYVFRHLTDALIDGERNWKNSSGNFAPYYPEFEREALTAIGDYAIFGACVFVMGFFQMCCWHTVAERQMHKIRVRYFEAVLRQNMGWFDKNETGALTTKMTDGVDRIKDGIGDKLGALCCYTAQFFTGIGIAFYMSWRMTLVMLAFMPLFIIPMTITGAMMKKIAPRELSAYGKAGAVAEEVISGIRTVLAFNGQNKEIIRYETHLREGERFGIKKALLTSAGTAFIISSLFVSMGVSFYYGTQLVIWGKITPGVTFAVFWACISGTFALGQAAPQIGVIMGAKAAAAPIFGIIDREPPINSQSTEGKILHNPKGTISVKDLHFRYPSRPDAKIIKGVSVSIAAGQHIAFVGHSGSGKSTLLGLLLRYYEQEQGLVTIDGVDVRQLNIAHLRQIVGVVSQEPALFADTIANNLRLGNADMTEDDMQRVCKMANAHDFVMQLPQKYNTRIGDGGVQLSGGQKQRIAIARALARDPTILLLDEATSALDTESESVVQAALDQAGQGRTTISIAHRLSTIKNVDCIYVFDSGVIVEIGTHDELMAKGGHYSELVKAQEIEKHDETKKHEDEEYEDIIDRRLSKASRRSRRMSRAISMASEVDRKIAELQEEAAEEHVSPSSIVDIIKFARPEWCSLFISLLLSIVRGLTFPIFSIVYGSMFTTLTTASDSDKLHGALINGLYFWGIALMSLVSTLGSGFLMGKAGESITTRMRLKVFRNILRQDGNYFDNPHHSSGKLTTRLATDVPNIRAAIDQRLADVLQAISAMVAGISIGFCYGPAMAPIGVAASVTLILIQTLIAKYLKVKGQKDAEVAEEPSRLATEAIEQHKTVQYLTRERYFVEKYVELMEGPHRNAIIRGMIQSVTFALSASYVFFNFAMAYRYGLWLVKRAVCSPYTVFQVIEALNCASMSLLAFATYFPEYVRARLSAGLMFNMLGIEPKIDGLNEGGKKPKLNGDIEFSSLYFSYPVRREHMVLNGVHLTIPRGKTVALVGPSGCGKSTSIQMIERYYDPVGGRLLFDKEDSREINLQHLRNQISLVGQEPTLFNYTIRENIAYGMANATAQEIEDAARLANAHDFISKLPDGYNTVVGERGGQLSGGQKQRVAIARAVIRNPKILLLDEATSALDTESEKIVQEALERARAGRTCVVIAHRLSSIQNADIIVVMKDGRLIEQGNHQSLLSRGGLYSNLVKAQGLS